MDEILLGAEVPLRSLDGCVSQKQLDLLKLPAGSAAQLGARAAEIVRRDAGNTRSRSVSLEKLPHHLFAHSVIVSLIAPVHPTQDRTIGNLRQSAALFATAISFISVLLLGHIGSHLDLTSGWPGHQAKLGRVRD